MNAEQIEEKLVVLIHAENYAVQKITQGTKDAYKTAEKYIEQGVFEKYQVCDYMDHRPHCMLLFACDGRKTDDFLSEIHKLNDVWVKSTVVSTVILAPAISCVVDFGEKHFYCIGIIHPLLLKTLSRVMIDNDADLIIKSKL